MDIKKYKVELEKGIFQGVDEKFYISEKILKKVLEDYCALISNDIINDLELKTKAMESIVNNCYNEDVKGVSKTIFEQFYIWLNEKKSHSN